MEENIQAPLGMIRKLNTENRFKRKHVMPLCKKIIRGKITYSAFGNFRVHLYLYNPLIQKIKQFSMFNFE